MAEKADISAGIIKEKSNMFDDFPYLGLMMPLKIRMLHQLSNRLTQHLFSREEKNTQRNYYRLVSIAPNVSRIFAKYMFYHHNFHE